MTPREYGQACSLACALDRIGERWTLLIVRELSLGPLRFSDLARAVGGAPTDVLTKRLRDLEQHGIVARRELDPPASATVYELTELGRGLERPMIELGRWGMDSAEARGRDRPAPSSLPNALRVILQPPADLRGDARPCAAAASPTSCASPTAGSRPRAARPPTPTSSWPARRSASSPPWSSARRARQGVEIEGDRELLEELRSMVVIPEHLREEALCSGAQSAGSSLLLVELDDAHGALGRGVDAEVAEDALVEVALDDFDAGVGRLEDVDRADFLQLRRPARRRRRPRRRPRRR